MITIICHAQNQTDQKGLKQGHWIKKYPHGVTMYEGTFVDNHPVGEFKRYYDTGILQSVMNFSDDGKEADAVLYYPGGKPASKGHYSNQLKTGKWQFFSPDSSYVINEETYKSDRKEGLSVKFYPGGKTAEKINYSNDLRNGEWIRYYENGNLWIKASYASNLLHGKFESWHENGKLQMSGMYKYDRKEGPWMIFDQNGVLLYKITYTEGVPDNRQMDIDASNLIDSLEKNKGTIPDPEKTGEMW
ncbi:MAG TPA: toxin-antitoxin system YwqK family antitoxin [Bacteroidales bacterium]|nr:toxin-antitoxin system YwqK family antitoxin [Bacteroidales bacterium]